MATSCERQTSKTSTLRSVQQHLNFNLIVLALAAITCFALTSTPAAAQTLPDAQLIEWDCPLAGPEAQTPPVDPSPGALVADGDFVWFVTTIAQQRLVRFSPGVPKATGLATCTWWDLDELTVDTSGIRLKPSGGNVFIRTFDNLQRIETATNRRTSWADGLLSLSDVAVRISGGTTQVFSTGFSDAQATHVVQRLTPSSNGSATVRRWSVGGGAGDPFIPGSYLSGIDVPLESNKSHLVYYSEPESNMIGELNTNTGVVRRWSLGTSSSGPCDVFAPDLAVVCQPRQLDAAFGMVWVVTGSGHIVRLNPTNNELFVAPIPTLGAPTASAFNNPIGISANGVIGYTAAGEVGGFNKVGMLVPNGTTTVVIPTSSSAPITDSTLTATPITVTRFAGPAVPFVKNALSMQTETTGGTFFEANLDISTPATTAPCGAPVDPDPEDEFVPSPDDPCAPSTLPRGIDDDPSGAVGDYYAAIGGSTLRIAHVSLPTGAEGIVTGGGVVSATTTVTNPITGDVTTTTTEKGTFGMVAMRKNGQLPKGHVTYHNHDSGDSVISIEVTDLTFVDNTAVVGGLCKTGSNCVQFRVDVADNGQPWNTPRDTFQIVKDPILGMGVGEGGELTGGNIKVQHQD